MRRYSYRLLNVFAESMFGGNPLCVFDDAAANASLSTVEMQSLALQFNLSETTFLLGASNASATVRIFTPTFEMAFAGHPTLGSAHVVRDVMKAGDAVTLSMKAGVIAVSARQDRWELRANTATNRAVERTDAELAAVLGLDATDVLPGARWVNTGSEQLIIPLASTDAVRRAAPKADLLGGLASDIGRSMAYVFAADGPDKLVSRFFFMKHGGIVEDPGTGSATANLGGWYLARQTEPPLALPMAISIVQGEAVNRPCHLSLRLDEARNIYVGGQVIEIGRGVIALP